MFAGTSAGASAADDASGFGRSSGGLIERQLASSFLTIASTSTVGNAGSATTTAGVGPSGVDHRSCGRGALPRISSARDVTIVVSSPIASPISETSLVSCSSRSTRCRLDGRDRNQASHPPTIATAPMSDGMTVQ